MRRAFDVTVASVGLLVVAPFMLLTAVLIRLSSAGPVFYGQERIGRFGKPFRFLKFRTMRVGDGGPAVTADGDVYVAIFKKEAWKKMAE